MDAVPTKLELSVREPADVPARSGGRAGPHADRHRRLVLRRMVTAAVVTVTLLALVGTERSVLARSEAEVRGDAMAAALRALQHPGLWWLVSALAVEAASMASLATMQRRLLGAGGTVIAARSALAVVYASDAISGTVPVAGAEMGTAFTFRQYQRLGAGRALTAWMLLVSGVMSSMTFAVVVAVSAVVSGNDAAVFAGAGGPPALTVGAAAIVLAWHNAAARARMRAGGVATVRIVQRLTGRPAGDPRTLVDAAAGQLSAFRPRRGDWIRVGGAGLVNWLADAACLALAARMVGVHLPLSAVGLVWAAGATAGTLRVTPGGVGTVEPAMVAALTATGVTPGRALTAVLGYRLISFWSVVLIGWSVQAAKQVRRSAPAEHHSGTARPRVAGGAVAPSALLRPGHGPDVCVGV